MLLLSAAGLWPAPHIYSTIECSRSNGPRLIFILQLSAAGLMARASYLFVKKRTMFSFSQINKVILLEVVVVAIVRFRGFPL